MTVILVYCAGFASFSMPICLYCPILYAALCAALMVMPCSAGMAGELFADVEKALDDRTIGHNPERLSTLKGGIVYSNAVTTVSPTFAEEILLGGGFVS